MAYLLEGGPGQPRKRAGVIGAALPMGSEERKGLGILYRNVGEFLKMAVRGLRY